MIFHGRFMGAVLGYSNLKSVDPRSGVHLVINILFWIIRGFLVCVPSWGGAAFLGAGRLFLAEAQEKAIGEPLKSLLKRNARRLRLNYSPATMFTLTLTGGHKDRWICWCFFIVFFFLLQMPRNTFEEMKYLEIMIVSDHSMVGVPLRAEAINVDFDVTLWLFFYLLARSTNDTGPSSTRGISPSPWWIWWMLWVNLCSPLRNVQCLLYVLWKMYTHTRALRRWCLYYRRRFISVFSSCINHIVDTWCCCSLFSMCNTALLIVTLMILNGPYSLSPCAQMFLQMISNPRRPSGLLRQINMSLNNDISLSKMHIFYRWGPDTEFLIAQTPTHR